MEYKDILGRDLQVGDYVLLATSKGDLRRAKIREFTQRARGRTDDKYPIVKVTTIILQQYGKWPSKLSKGNSELTPDWYGIDKSLINCYRLGTFEDAFTHPEREIMVKNLGYKA